MKKGCNLRRDLSARCKADLSGGVKYWIFRTKWGYFGVAGSQKGLLRTYLPQSKKADIKRRILREFPSAKSEKRPFQQVIKDVLEYFGGRKVNFGDIRVAFNGLSPFAVKVLSVCRKVGYGNAISYGKLAKEAGKAGAARAVGKVMAENPLPLIVPCHRVIRSNGKLGGFSAIGGINTKKKLIDLERK